MEHRISISKKICEKYPDRIPVLIEPFGKQKEVPFLTLKKFIVPEDITLAKFISQVRNKHTDQLILKEEQALFFMINNILPPVGSLMGDLYKRYKDNTGFLVFHIQEESVFGFSSSSS